MICVNQYHTHLCGEVSEADIGKKIRVAGWVENIRDHGGVSFIDLRDMYAVMQIVIRDGKLLEGIRKEQAITVEGLIEKRDEETYNPKIPTGTIELDAKEVTVLGEVYSQLPFEVMTSKSVVHEDVRLKYRYLDLRNQKVKDNIIFRSKVVLIFNIFNNIFIPFWLCCFSPVSILIKFIFIPCSPIIQIHRIGIL